MADHFVAKASEFEDGDRIIIMAGRKEIGVFRHSGRFYAYSNYCPHAGGPACEGIVINRIADVIDEDRQYRGQTFSDEVNFVCPWHGYEYDLTTGVCRGDRRIGLEKFDVVQRGEDIFVVA